MPRNQNTRVGDGTASSPRGDIGFQEPLDNDHITPHADGLRVLFICVKMTRVCGWEHTPENRAVLRHLALKVLWQEQSARIDRIGQPP